ncbi:hypothetical protein [Bradyrhizobium sp. SZCCHNRI1073]|uniref:hypothetical protein n=1 Tax=Bradyrhizobium sp. SZCCHNRI1073 TaxID=3057280 RepID=UPI002916AFCD|nr:hypothetical protein [Bradyrhizobium sp. SZCCHNRI1073]
MSVDLICVDPKEVSLVWEYAGGMIRAAIERTNLSDFAEIEKDVLSGDQLLWLAVSDHIEAAATTQLSRNVCTLTACSGHQRERWLPLFKMIEKYAKDEGCQTMRIFGRKGWERVLDGYHVEHVVLEKDLGRQI